jgi:hypothetical protein
MTSSCPHCNADNYPTEVSGLRIHMFSDRLILCTGRVPEQPHTNPEQKRSPFFFLTTPLARFIFASSLFLLRAVISRLPIHFR